MMAQSDDGDEDDEGMGTDETASATPAAAAPPPAARRLYKDPFDSEDSLSIKQLLLLGVKVSKLYNPYHIDVMSCHLSLLL
jgi:hypothetical protein